MCTLFLWMIYSHKFMNVLIKINLNSHKWSQGLLSTCHSHITLVPLLLFHLTHVSNLHGLSSPAFYIFSSTVHVAVFLLNKNKFSLRGKEKQQCFNFLKSAMLVFFTFRSHKKIWNCYVMTGKMCRNYISQNTLHFF